MIFQNIFHYPYGFHKQFLRLYHIQLSCYIKNFSKAVPASENLLLILSFILKRLLIHFLHKEKFFLNQSVFFCYKFYILFILQPYITTDSTCCKIKNKWNPVGSLIKQSIYVYILLPVCCNQRTSFQRSC